MIKYIVLVETFDGPKYFGTWDSYFDAKEWADVHAKEVSDAVSHSIEVFIVMNPLA